MKNLTASRYPFVPEDGILFFYSKLRWNQKKKKLKSPIIGRAKFFKKKKKKTISVTKYLFTVRHNCLLTLVQNCENKNVIITVL